MKNEAKVLHYKKMMKNFIYQQIISLILDDWKKEKVKHNQIRISFDTRKYTTHSIAYFLSLRKAKLCIRNNFD
jgi:hypothetical protein